MRFVLRHASADLEGPPLGLLGALFGLGHLACPVDSFGELVVGQDDARCQPASLADQRLGTLGVETPLTHEVDRLQSVRQGVE